MLLLPLIAAAINLATATTIACATTATRRGIHKLMLNVAINGLLNSFACLMGVTRCCTVIPSCS